MIPVAFPDPGKHDDKEFVAFAIVAALVISEMRTNPDTDAVGALKTLWAAATGRPEMTDFSAQLNERVAAENWLDRLGLPADAKFRAAGVHYYCKEHGHQTVEMIAVGVHSPELVSQPPDADQVTEDAFNQVVVECAAAAGFEVTRASLDPDTILSQSPGMAEAIKDQLDKKINEETAAFRADLDKVFQTWKGGTDDSHQSE